MYPLGVALRSPSVHCQPRTQPLPLCRVILTIMRENPPAVPWFALEGQPPGAIVCVNPLNNLLIAQVQTGGPSVSTVFVVPGVLVYSAPLGWADQTGVQKKIDWLLIRISGSFHFFIGRYNSKCRIVSVQTWPPGSRRGLFSSGHLGPGEGYFPIPRLPDARRTFLNCWFELSSLLGSN